MTIKPIIPCLWYDKNAEEAANLYIRIFKNGNIKKITKYGKAGHEIHKMPEGMVMTVEFEINGHEYLALNGGPFFKFNESVSFQVFCDTQEEIDYYWNEFIKDGGQEGQCGWLKDRFGLSWQIVPTVLEKLLDDPEKAEAVTEAFLKMKKYDISKLKEAAGSIS